MAAFPSAAGALCRAHPRRLVAPAGVRPGARDATDVEGSVARPSDALASARLLVGGATEARFWSETWTSPDALLTELTGLLRAARPARFVQVDDGFRADRT